MNFNPQSASWKGMLLAGVMLAISGSAQAIPFSISGDTVDFTFDNSLTGLLGAASVSGDILYFNPTNFKAQAQNGSSANPSQSFNVQISLKPGFLFDSVDLLERGDYLFYGLGTNTANVGGSLNLSSGANTFNATIVPGAPLNLPGFSSKNWVASVNANLVGWGPTVTADLTSMLMATTSGTGNFALVEQKYAGLIIHTTPVPEVETWAMMLAGLGLVGLQLRRRSGSSARVIR